MFIDMNGARLPVRALEEKITKTGGITYGIWWSRIPAQVMTYDKINELLDELDSNSNLTYKDTKDGCYTLSRPNLMTNGYFIRPTKGDSNKIEVCGMKSEGRDCKLFRYCISQSYDEEFGALDAWIEFKDKVNKCLGVSFDKMFGGLPREYHQYRYCVPSPINWATSSLTMYSGSVSGECVKADICSAYGSEASKTLPNCRLHLGKVVNGTVEPTEDFPFAFYLESGHMAVWGEGNTFELYKSKYITHVHTNLVAPQDDKTLLLPSSEYCLRQVFEELYDGRKDNPNNKAVMNMTIGMFHRKKWYEEKDNLWPLAAVIKYRCNKRIVDTCEDLVSRGQRPILINTDSIMWEGNDATGFDTEKKLGNFVIEYRRCIAVIRSSKIYQIYDLDTQETITRWSGSHTKKYTSMLSFGRIWDPKVYEYLRSLENQNTIKWDKHRRRYVNKLNQNYQAMEELPEWITK